MPNYRKYERCESHTLRELMLDINRIHAEMGRRDKRPERVALIKCMNILRKELTRSEETPQ